MKNIFSIAGREIRANFVTPVAYAVIAGFVLLAGFFFFTLLQQFNTIAPQASMMQDMTPSLNQWVVEPFYQTLEVVLVFLIPILTMRSIAEEKRSGTFELLLTSPVKLTEIVLGKFLGAAVVMGTMLLCSFVFPLVLIVFSDPELLPIIIGFLGLLLYGLAFTALGIAVSSFTKSQTVAGVVGMVLMLLLYVIDAPAAKFEGAIASVFKYLAPASHLQMFTKGVIDGSSIIYFLTVVVIGLFITNRVLEVQRWR